MERAVAKDKDEKDKGEYENLVRDRDGILRPLGSQVLKREGPMRRLLDEIVKRSRNLVSR